MSNVSKQKKQTTKVVRKKPTKVKLRRNASHFSRFAPLGFVVIFGLLGAYFIFSSSAATPGATAASCNKAVGPFRMQGSNIYQANGKLYVPYGMTVTGLANPTYASLLPQTTAQIEAAANSWCINTVRLQVAPDNLLGARGTGGTAYSAAFMTALQSEVTLAEKLHLVVVISAQTENNGNALGPNNTTLLFWKNITKAYGSDPQVVFDLFNEPRVATSSYTENWVVWQQGNGSNYYGMQTVANDVRSYGSKNLFWIEGPDTASTLSRASKYPIHDNLFMYSIHHPSGAHDVATWNYDFGYLVNQHIAPVVEGEWTNFSSPRLGECWPDAPTAVPAYLKYLKQRNIGVAGWALLPGVLVKATSTDLTNPSVIKKDWACADGLNEGAGNLIMQWFIRGNSTTSDSASTSDAG